MTMQEALLVFAIVHAASAMAQDRFAAIPPRPVAGEPFVLELAGTAPGPVLYFRQLPSVAVADSEITLGLNLSAPGVGTPKFAFGGFDGTYLARQALTVPAAGTYGVFKSLPGGIRERLATLSIDPPRPAATPASTTLSGNFFAPDEDGAGVNVIQGPHGAVAAWFTYGSGEFVISGARTTWYVISGGKWISPHGVPGRDVRDLRRAHRHTVRPTLHGGTGGRHVHALSRSQHVSRWTPGSIRALASRRSCSASSSKEASMFFRAPAAAFLALLSPRRPAGVRSNPRRALALHPGPLVEPAAAPEAASRSSTSAATRWRSGTRTTPRETRSGTPRRASARHRARGRCSSIAGWMDASAVSSRWWARCASPCATRVADVTLDGRTARAATGRSSRSTLSGIRNEVDHTGSYFDPANNGWGLTLTQQGDVLGGVLYTYDTVRHAHLVRGLRPRQRRLGRCSTRARRLPVLPVHARPPRSPRDACLRFPWRGRDGAAKQRHLRRWPRA